MKVLAVYPKDVYAQVEFSTKQIDMILEFLDNSEIRYSKDDNPKLHEAVSYVQNDLFTKMQTLFDDITQGEQHGS